jgi:hypothetical protein
VHAHPPLRRAILHAPGGHWLGTDLHHFHAQPHFVSPHFVPYYSEDPAAIPNDPLQSTPVEPVEVAPAQDLPLAPSPPLLEGEALPQPGEAAWRPAVRG